MNTIKCNKCGYEWHYRGKNEYFARCPQCKSRVKIKKKYCLDCGKEICCEAKRCRICSNRTAEKRAKLSEKQLGVNNSMYNKTPWNKNLPIKLNNALEEWRRKGGKPWNKGMTGIHLSPKTEFKKGNRYSPRTEFKKGETPWIKGKHHTEDIKALLREKRMKQKIPTKNTSIEIKLYQILNELGVKYKTHQPVIGITQPDAFIEPNICIYVDGDYWHSLSEVRERDKKINKQLLKKGFTVLRFSESRVNNDIDGVIKDIVDLLRARNIYIVC